MQIRQLEALQAMARTSGSKGKCAPVLVTGDLSHRAAACGAAVSADSVTPASSISLQRNQSCTEKQADITVVFVPMNLGVMGAGGEMNQQLIASVQDAGDGQGHGHESGASRAALLNSMASV